MVNEMNPQNRLTLLYLKHPLNSSLFARTKSGETTVATDFFDMFPAFWGSEKCFICKDRILKMVHVLSKHGALLLFNCWFFPTPTVFWETDATGHCRLITSGDGHGVSDAGAKGCESKFSRILVLFE